MAAAEASTADQQHSASRATHTAQWNHGEGEKAQHKRGVRAGRMRHSNGRSPDAAAAAPPLGAILTDALALALAQHAGRKPCSASDRAAESEDAREESEGAREEPEDAREQPLTKEVSAAKAGNAVAAPCTAAAPRASLPPSCQFLCQELAPPSLRPATDGGVTGCKGGGGESDATIPEVCAAPASPARPVAERRWNGSPRTREAERGRSRCASSNEGARARRSLFSADQPAALAEAALEIEAPMLPSLMQGTNPEPVGSGGTSCVTQGGTSWAGLFGAAASTTQPQVQLLAAQQADARAEAQQQQLAGWVDAELPLPPAVSLPLPLPSLPPPQPPLPLRLPLPLALPQQQAHAVDFWHPRKNKARVALSTEGPAALASAPAVYPELPLTQPVRLLRRTSTQEHWQREAVAAAAAERAPPLATSSPATLPASRAPILQIEYYFSDANLQSDFFLRKHIEADAHGFVALELLNSFPQSSVVKRPLSTGSSRARRLCLFRTAPRSKLLGTLSGGEDEPTGRPGTASAARASRLQSRRAQYLFT